MGKNKVIYLEKILPSLRKDDKYIFICSESETEFLLQTNVSSSGTRNLFRQHIQHELDSLLPNAAKEYCNREQVAEVMKQMCNDMIQEWVDEYEN